jgi:hypothetical protein
MFGKLKTMTVVIRVMEVITSYNIAEKRESLNKNLSYDYFPRILQTSFFDILFI